MEPPMSSRFLRYLPLLAAVCFLTFSAAASGASPVSYELKFERPNSHLLDVTIHADALSGATVDFAIPGLGARLLLHRKLRRERATFPRALSGRPGTHLAQDGQPDLAHRSIRREIRHGGISGLRQHAAEQHRAIQRAPCLHRRPFRVDVHASAERIAPPHFPSQSPPAGVSPPAWSTPPPQLFSQ